MILSRCSACGHPAGKHVPLNDRGSRRGACTRGGCLCSQYRVEELRGDGEAFPERRDPKYRAWISTLPCIVAGKVWKGTLPTGHRVTFAHQCAGRVDPAHVQTRATGAPDVGACLPCCRRAHDWQEDCGGIEVWAQGYGWTLEELHQMALALVPVWERDVLGVGVL